MTSTARRTRPARLDDLLAEIRACDLCAAHLPRGPRPIIHAAPSARLLIVSQAPGTRVHETGISFNDRSGDRLREWLGIEREPFYDERRVALMPVGFCYPGRAPKGGDLPPRRECAPRWHDRVRTELPRIELTLLVGSYAIDYYMPQFRGQSMTETVRAWRAAPAGYFPLPHPSWRTTAWEQHNPWFRRTLIPALRERVAALL